MNILMALSQLEVTGAEAYATSLGNALTARGHTLFYVSDTLTKTHHGDYFMLRFNKRSLLRRIWHILYLFYLIKKHKIQLVHAHSRASSWSCHIACKLTHTPMLTSVHGRQPVHFSRKHFHAMGDKVLPVCEAIYTQLIDELNLPKNKLEISRNGINTEHHTRLPLPQNHKKNISIIGRLTGPKGEICYRLLSECLELDKYDVKVISGSKIDKRFKPFLAKADFVGYSDNIPNNLAKADLVIGAGRVAIESIMCGRPTFAIGEARSLGLVTKENINEAMATNFGDIGPKDIDIDFSLIPKQIEQALNARHCENEITEIIQRNYDLQQVTSQLEHIYQSLYSQVKRFDIPVLMYHRFNENNEEQGISAPLIHIKKFENHLKLLKFFGFESLTFSDLQQHGLAYRMQSGKRYCMITVDDGYQDNYHLMLPLLEKYGFKATVYVVTGVNYNKWDIDRSPLATKPLALMDEQQLKALASSPLIEIGGHTLTHPFLSRLSYKEKQQEIVENKLQLEKIIDEPLLSFAYPYGDLDLESKTIVQQAGYQYALATDSGPLALHEDLFEIRRIGIFRGTDSLAFARKVTGGYLYRKSKG